jgi:D-cysteine desulfhydrase
MDSPPPPRPGAVPSGKLPGPRIPLGRFPTALDTVDVAGRTILVKRDDLCADGYAGNKVRKLEFLLADAQQRGARTLITAGATGSHHAFATAYYGSRLGFDVSLVLFPQRVTQHVREMLLHMHATGAELRWIRRVAGVPFGMWRARLAHRAAAPYLVPPGGSSDIGSLGYVNAGLELAAQLEDAAVRPARIHVAAGTLGTVAGVAIGMAWAGARIPIIATRIASRLFTNERTLGNLVRATLRLLAARGATGLPDAASALRLVALNHRGIGTGYGHATAAGEAAHDAFAAAGLMLDSTYTAKAAAALLADRTPGSPLFWHTLSAVLPRLPVQDADTAALPAPFHSYLGR